MPISLATTEHTDMPTLFLTREEETDASSARKCLPVGDWISLEYAAMLSVHDRLGTVRVQQDPQLYYLRGLPTYLRTYMQAGSRPL